MRSMTGYGRAIVSNESYNIKIEMKSVNQRYFDASIRLPRNLIFLEDKLRSIIKSKINRGRIDVFINLDVLNDELNTPRINLSKARAYKAALDELILDLNINDKVSLRNLLLMDDLFKSDNSDLSEDELLIESITECLNKALDELIKMKSIEGENISVDLKNKLNLIKTNVDSISKRAPIALEENISALKDRILDRIEEFNHELNEDRLYNEIVFYTDRLSIDEEVMRLSSHISQFGDCLIGKNPIGKRLDFIVQEMNREINTIGSKASDSEITNLVIELKSIVEMIREQIQNIE